MDIIKDGTGRVWERSHNATWSRNTRPIVEAFWHARYMLDQAIRYGREYDKPLAVMD